MVTAVLMATERGFTYLGLLFAVAVMGVVLAGAGQVWHTAAKREKERELLFIGNQYRQAIGRYYEASSGAKQYPAKLEELIEDKRFPKPQRHLRKLYTDPMSGRADWGLVVAAGRITGVYSLSEDVPLKTGNFAKLDAEFAQRTRYADWRFVHRPDAVSAGTSGSSAEPDAGAEPVPEIGSPPLVPAAK